MPAIISGRPRPTSAPKASNGSLTGAQKACAVLAAVLIGPSIVKKFYEKPAYEKVDLSSFNIVTHYDKPAIEKMDST